jgi:hypothetical protein
VGVSVGVGVFVGVSVGVGVLVGVSVGVGVLVAVGGIGVEVKVAVGVKNELPKDIVSMIGRIFSPGYVNWYVLGRHAILRLYRRSVRKALSVIS